MRNNDLYQARALDEMEEADSSTDIPVQERMIWVGKAIVYALLDIAEAIRDDDETTQAVSEPKSTLTTADILTTFIKG